VGDLGRPEEKWQPTGWGAVAQAERGRRAQDRAFLFLVFFHFLQKNILNFFYRSSSLAPWPGRQGAWLPGRGARGPGALVYGARVPGTPT